MVGQFLRFDERNDQPIVNRFRTGLAAASIYPSAIKGLVKGAMTMSKKEAINTTVSSLGDLGTKFAGLDIAVKGKQNLEDFRPAVFCFNHQSSADFFIVLKLLRKDVTGIAKKELEYESRRAIFKNFRSNFYRSDLIKRKLLNH